MKKIDFSFIKNLTNKQKIIGLGILLFVLIDLVLCIFLFATRKHSAVKLNSVTSAPVHSAQSLVALNSSARKGMISEQAFAYFKFTANQKKNFLQVYEENGTAALTVRINLCPTDKQKNRITSNDMLRIGYLFEDSFTSRGKLIVEKYPLSNFNNRIEVQAKEDDFSGFVDISFALKKNADMEKNLPCGFYVYSDQKCKIKEACVSQSLVGFDVSGSVPFYGFAYNGGKIDFKNTNFDFSGSQMVFPSENTSRQQLPQFVLQFSENEEFKSTSEKNQRVEINLGGEKFFVNNVKNASKLIIPCGALKNPFGRVELISNAEYINSILMKNVPAEDNSKEILNPVLTDPGLILNYQQSAWRNLDYEIYQWDRFPEIIFFDTRDYKVQERFFSRMAFFVEKEGYKGKLLTNEELDGKHGYNAHDYSAESMAKFFNKAVAQNFKLNKEELLLKKILLKNGMIEIAGAEKSAIESVNIEKCSVKANQGGIVSISRECPEWSRTNLLAHEGWHTLFFRDEDFRNFVSAVYYTFDPTSLAFLIDYFKSQPALGYDVNDEYLMHNEFMAYIMQQKVSAVGDYFVHCANRGTVIKYTPDLAAYVRQTQGIGFEDAAVALNDFVFDKYGIVCGNIALVNRNYY